MQHHDIYTNNFKKFNSDPRKIACYYGVAPFGKQSGTSVNTPARTSHFANKLIKSLYHSEVNGSDTEPVEFLKIWILPKQNDTQPLYRDFDITGLKKKNEPYAIVSQDGSSPASLLQDCWFSLLDLDKNKQASYSFHSGNNGVYIFLVERQIAVEETVLNRRDGLGVYDTGSVNILGKEDSQVLLIEVPVL